MRNKLFKRFDPNDEAVAELAYTKPEEGTEGPQWDDAKVLAEEVGKLRAKEFKRKLPTGSFGPRPWKYYSKAQKDIFRLAALFIRMKGGL